MKFLKSLIIILILTSCGSSSSRERQSIKTIISLENRIQNSNLSEWDKSGSNYMDLCYILVDRQKHPSVTFLINQMESIDRLSNKLILEIDHIKRDLLKRGNEKIKSKESKFHNFRCQFLSYNLNEVVNQLNLEPSEFVFFKQNRSEKLFNKYALFVQQLLKLTSSYDTRSSHYSFSPKLHYPGDSFADKLNNFKLHFKASKANIQDDEFILIQLFTDLFKPENMKNEEGEKVNWVENQFRNTTLVEAIANLTILQNDVLKAKSTAIQCVNYRITSCREYPFDTFIPIVNGPSTVKSGRDAEIFVRFGAYDSNEKPIVTSSDGSVWYEGDGAGTIKFKAKKGLNKFKGEILFRKKSGEMHRRPWEWSVYGVE
jgi:hypothetical protein